MRDMADATEKEVCSPGAKDPENRRQTEQEADSISLATCRRLPQCAVLTTIRAVAILSLKTLCLSGVEGLRADARRQAADALCNMQFFCSLMLLSPTRINLQQRPSQV